MAYGSTKGRRHRGKGWQKRKRPMYFAGTPGQHRADAASWGKEAQRFAKKARAAAKDGDCRTALHLFGVAAYRAGLSAGNRKWADVRRPGYLGGSRLGSHVHNLQKTVFRLCKVR